MNNTSQNVVNFASMQANSQSSSETTTSHGGRGLSTGTPRSAPGLETLRSLTATAIKADAREINQTLTASLLQDFGSRLVIKTRCNSDYEHIGYDICLSGSVPAGWIKAMEYYTKPAGGAVTAMEVTRLRSLTAKRKEGGLDLEMSIGALTEELSVYPEDIVRTVCRNWARNNKFFPVLCELINACEALLGLRRAVMDALQSKPERIEQRDAAYTPPTEEDKAKVTAIMQDYLSKRQCR